MRLLIRMRANGLTWCFMKSCRGRFPINTNSGATCGVSTLSNWTAARLALQEAGHADFRDARGPLGFTQRQAGGKFTRDEAEQLIAHFEGRA